MNQIKQSIWKQDRNGEWKLFFNTEINNLEGEVEQKQKSFGIKQINQKILNLGTLVMTPEGIGRLLKFMLNKKKKKKIKKTRTKKK